jgi:DNA-binding MarR family transcriptional regulator
MIMATAPSNPLLGTLKETMISIVRSDVPDMSARQLAVFLKIYLEPGTDHTVRGLAADLKVSKPAITRALDRLEESNLAKREEDKRDRRSVIVKKTPPGSAYLRTLGGYLTAASKAAAKAG